MKNSRNQKNNDKKKLSLLSCKISHPIQLLNWFFFIFIFGVSMLCCFQSIELNGVTYENYNNNKKKSKQRKRKKNIKQSQ